MDNYTISYLISFKIDKQVYDSINVIVKHSINTNNTGLLTCIYNTCLIKREINYFIIVNDIINNSSKKLNKIFSIDLRSRLMSDITKIKPETCAKYLYNPEMLRIIRF